MAGAGTVVWFVILIVMFIGGIRKSKNQKHPSGRQGKTGNTDQSVRTYPQRAQSQKQSSRSETKQRNQAKKETLGSQFGETGKTQRQDTHNMSGRASNQHVWNESTDGNKRQNAGQEELFEQNQIVAAAKANTREVEQDNDMDAENEHLMDAVYDAIVKGPENTMEFQRDFIAEGMDMLSSFDL